ncbi:MAG: M20/M25/M40 family metallo-hydrolase, partial [Eubacteriales bacterium]
DVVCITMNPEAAACPITFSGHMDTVHPIGAFGSPAVRRDKEKIYGPGVIDCKGGIAAAFLAMDALHQCGFKSRPIQLLLQSDEENGSRLSQKATINYICEKSRNSIAFLNLEGHTAGEACLQRKGIITFTFTVKGVEAHASQCACIGANAIAEAAYKILEIEKIKDAEGITCCCGIISGGSAVNTVPGQCEFKVNVRFATVSQQKWICEYMQNIADKVYITGCKTTVQQSSYRIAMEYSKKNAELLETINKSFKESGLPLLTASKRTGGSDAADVTAYGVPCVDSLGVVGGKIHTSEEFAYIDSLAESAKRLVSVVLYMSK